ncbi:serine/threonine-protein kinase HAL4/sat4 [Rhizophlyctis rosea]|uniref:non-specific serine/threonine protein kinase n=1 Tax=Rhizophlyctis rosea TaxID=64517 RepID=A0AAD5X788_9FUNG|nr:serine/threonine-protein kinase HAL4/sat4 [Rhizophlyctis rosea]
MGLPPRRNILYRIFHPNEESDSARLARSRRSYGSGSEAESEDDYHSDDSTDHDGVFSDMSRRPSASHHPESQKLNVMTKKERKAPAMFASDTEGSDTDTSDAEQRPAAKRSGSSKNLFKDLLQGGRKKDKDKNSGATSPQLNGSTSSASHHSSGDDSARSSDSENEHHPQPHNLFKDLVMGTRSKKASPNTSAAPVRKPSLNDTSTSTLSHVLQSSHLTPTTTTLPGMARSISETSLSKYGKKEEVLGKGANAVVRLCCPVNSEKKYAIKEFRKRRKDETQKEYVKKLIAEFCISSTLRHDNVVTTVDLIQDEVSGNEDVWEGEKGERGFRTDVFFWCGDLQKRQWCVVMEFCAGGDLYTRIHTGNLTEPAEIDCYFKQLLSGVQYLHSMGVAHRDLKPENLLLDSAGRILKITDFGVSDVFRAPFCTVSRKAKGVCGSGPYIAPEEFVKEGNGGGPGEYESEGVDVWSCGIIYYVMVYNSIPWKAAVGGDVRFKHFLEHKGNFWPLDRLPSGPKRLMYRILDPDPATRIKVPEILEDEWIKEVRSCDAGNEATVGHKHVVCERQKFVA